jgi:ABC-2 type transport system ATP-binding protein
MLELLARLGRDFQKSILLCTHLLGDVERVCQTVLILHKGRLLRQGGVHDLCARRHDRYILRIEGDPKAFIAELALEGVTAVADNEPGRWRITAPPGFATRTVFALAAHTNVTVTGLARDDESLEDLFHRVLREGVGGERRSPPHNDEEADDV